MRKYNLISALHMARLMQPSMTSLYIHCLTIKLKFLFHDLGHTKQTFKFVNLHQLKSRVKLFFCTQKNNSSLDSPHPLVVPKMTKTILVL